jgi:hypothetical protein
LNDTLKTRLLKLRALADRGVGGEAENAKRMLDAALKKNGVSIEELDDDRRDLHGFSFRDPTERSLLVQIMYSVLGLDARLFGYRNRPRTVLAEMTARQQADIDVLFRSHRKTLKRDIHLFMIAYFAKNNLISTRETPSPSTEKTPEEAARIKRIISMMKTVEAVSVRRQISR